MKFYINNLPAYKNNIKNYLEVGGGHGLYVKEAIQAFDSGVNFEVADISESSIRIAKNFVSSDLVKFTHIDIYEFTDQQQLVRLIAHELGHALGLEHVDDPETIMYRLNEGTNSIPTEADMNELKQVCRIK